MSNQKILIVSVTPQFLEKGLLWFQENEEKIKQAIKTQNFWRDSAIFIEKDREIKMGEFLRRLTEFGYEKTNFLFGKGEFFQRGNIIDVWPINLDCPMRIEFFGNKIEDITSLPNTESAKTAGTQKNSENLKKLKTGDYVVHIDHGIGVFREILNEDGQKFFMIEYAPPKDGASPDKLLVPVAQYKRLSLYIGFETPKIHRLGGSFWTNTKKRIREDAEKLAKDLLQIYSSREISRRPPYVSDKEMEKDFASQFEFIETEDQLKAWEDIKKDMSQEKPMDRLMCGDVGFGKTEVAMRAIFRAVASGRKALLIAPTTILAHEHFRSFQKRFEKFPIEIACLSRLTEKKDVKEILKKLENGKIDILIGTHRLLSADVLPAKNELGQNKSPRPYRETQSLIEKNGGTAVIAQQDYDAPKEWRDKNSFDLIVIDEEQRFGVKQKEKFKSLRSSADILSLSATPIPRTLQLSLAKLRDVSLIRTPPLGRVAIKNFTLPFSKKILKEAVRNEIERSGQIYILHNRVETIGIFAKKIKKIFNSFKKRPVLDIIHGRLEEKIIVRSLEKFRFGESDILVATTIIENGLDFSNVNTLIVDDASRLGLSQAYQIRGRIGRGDRQAYAYFLYKPKNLTEKSLERLEALKEFEKLGSGYDIALRDLEIRGGGNILGKEQSGAVNAVGLNLYLQILAEAVENVKN